MYAKAFIYKSLLARQLHPRAMSAHTKAETYARFSGSCLFTSFTQVQVMPAAVPAREVRSVKSVKSIFCFKSGDPKRLTIECPACSSVRRVDRRSSKGDGKDDGHDTGKQHPRPPERAWQAIRYPSIDERANNRNHIDLSSVSTVLALDKRTKLTPRGMMLISGTEKTSGCPLTL